MNHKIKSLFFKILSIFPNQMGYLLYYFFQNIKESKSFELKLRSAENTFTELIAICNTLSIAIKDKTILEIGSGWVPSLPYLFLFKGGVKRVLTYDINNHYQKKNLEKFNSLFEKKNRVKINVVKNKLPEQIQYFPNTDVIHCKDVDVNLIFSRFVLEHVNPNAIFLMHEKFKENFKQGTYIIHFISPSDHRAYSDKSLSLQDFLKYSPEEWDKIQTKFDYHNRLRYSQYIKIFESLNIEIVYKTFGIVKKDSNQYTLFKKLNLHEDYKFFSEEDLLAGNIVIVLKL
jgi:hypothetical protein